MEHALKHKGELEEELKASRTRCEELEEKSRKAEQGSRALSIDVENVKKDCISFSEEIDKISIEDELKKYKRLCDELKEKFTCLQEDYKLVCGREKRAQERISTMSEELNKMETETREKFVQLKVENRDLMREKKRAEDEIESWKKRFAELVESRDKLNTVSDGDKEKKEASNVTKSQEEANGVGNGACLDYAQVKNKSLNCDAGTNVPVNVGSLCPSPYKESRDVRSTGPLCICLQHEPLVKVKEEEDISSEPELQHGMRIRRQLEFQQDGSTNKKMAGSNPGSGRPDSGGVIDIIDSDDEASEIKIVAVATPNIRDKGKVPVSVYNSLKDEKGMTTENSLTRINSHQIGEENWSNLKESYELTSTPKRKRASNIITSDSEGDNDEDKIPISKLKMKKFQDLNHGPMGSPANQCSMAPSVSSGDGEVEESLTPPKRRLATLRECEERKNGLERLSLAHLVKNVSDAEYQVMDAAENTQDQEREDDGSDYEGESLDGFIVDGSDGSDGLDDEDTSTDSKDVGDDDLDFHQVISMIRRNRKSKSEWTFEADMLSSFQKDPELCMKAVCALYRLQTADEKSIKGSLHSNNRGFSKFDAFRGTKLAEFLLDGDPTGELKKTVEELEQHMPGGLDECSKLASHYSKQLFKIYQNKEDPYFP